MIFCIIGKSCSGKDSIFRKLREYDEMRLVPIIPYTTRPKREGEVEGIDYFYVNEDQINEYDKKGILVEKRVYNTIYGDWYYCTVDNGEYCNKEKNYITIATIEAVKDYEKYFGKELIFPIYIEVDDGIRLIRAIEREKRQIEPKYEELCRRFLADCEDFSELKIKELNLNKRYRNNDINMCLKEIINDIGKYIGNV